MFSLVGAGSHGTDIRAIAGRCGIHCSVFDDNPAVGEVPPDDLFGYVIFGSNYPKQRKEMANRFTRATPAKPLIDPSAIVGPDCQIGDGSVVAPFALLLASVTLGRHVHTNYGVQMTRCSVGDFSTLSPGAVICGDVTIGTACLVGAGAVVSDRCTIGDECVIAAGAVLPPLSEVPNGTTVIGVYKGASSN